MLVGRHLTQRLVVPDPLPSESKSAEEGDDDLFFGTMDHTARKMGGYIALHPIGLGDKSVTRICHGAAADEEVCQHRLEDGQVPIGLGPGMIIHNCR